MRRQSSLLHRKLRPCNVSLPEQGPREDVVILLHGFMATAGVFEPLEQHLHQEGVQHISSFSYHPFHSVASLGIELKLVCDRLPERVRLHLVGHSLGGIVARFYVQELGGAPRVEQIISLGSPFHGTTKAQKLPERLGQVSPLLRDISPDSEVLAKLRQDTTHLSHTSVIAGEDLLVTPPQSAAFPGSEIVVLDGVGHNGLLFDERVARLVSQKILSRYYLCIYRLLGAGKAFA